MSRTVAGLKSTAEANQVEVSKKLGILYEELVQARHEMTTASEDKAAILFETMMKNIYTKSPTCTVHLSLKSSDEYCAKNRPDSMNEYWTLMCLDPG